MEKPSVVLAKNLLLDSLQTEHHIIGLTPRNIAWSAKDGLYYLKLPGFKVQDPSLPGLDRHLRRYQAAVRYALNVHLGWSENDMTQLGKLALLTAVSLASAFPEVIICQPRDLIFKTGILFDPQIIDTESGPIQLDQWMPPTWTDITNLSSNRSGSCTIGMEYRHPAWERSRIIRIPLNPKDSLSD